MDVEVHQGTLLRNYPLEILPDAGSTVLADFTVPGGGIGHVPMVLKGADAGLELKAQRWDGTAWNDLEGVDVSGNTYYQAVLHADGTMDYTFTIPRPTSDLDAAWRCRILYVDMPTYAMPGYELLGPEDHIPCATSSSRLRRDDIGFKKDASSAWTVLDGVLENTGVSVDKVSEGALAQMIDLTSFADGPEDRLKLEFDYELADPSEILYVHLWGYVDVSSAASTATMNLESSNGHVWESAGTAMVAYNLGRPDGAFLQPNEGVASDAAVILAGAAGPQHCSRTFDLSGFASAPSMVSDYDYLAIGFSRNIDSASAPAVVISNVILTAAVADLELLTYEKWASDFGLTVPDVESSADPDADAADNLREYAFGGNPINASDVGHVPVFGRVAEGGTNFVEYTYPRRIGSESELNYKLELATDLTTGNWTNSGYVELPVTGVIDAEFESVSNRIDTAVYTNAFIRLLIEE
jgi:hypothetical protein